MKRNTWLLVSLTLLFLLLSGCGKSGSDGHSSSDETLEPIKVELTVNPTQVQTGEKVTFEAKVTHQGKSVDDAKEVVFEFWKDDDNEESHSMESVKSAGNGSYKFETAFESAGTYHVISHVTARDQHSMPSAEFKVIE
ncbi:YtkA-like protein [Fontibacillus phaseoli]|uniref:YtkA-like protein n=1 Tax=Fontibacillus phaseoli TaxID=1416533 RepID=A0A369BPH5_9BACL|nr:FixH family protein [Fontibacillus phaseoli]RCX23520.1 YtkA-like protein [Fontibacillus phaseoli]